MTGFFFLLSLSLFLSLSLWDQVFLWGMLITSPHKAHSRATGEGCWGAGMGSGVHPSQMGVRLPCRPCLPHWVAMQRIEINVCRGLLERSWGWPRDLRSHRSPGNLAPSRIITSGVLRGAPALLPRQPSVSGQTAFPCVHWALHLCKALCLQLQITFKAFYIDWESMHTPGPAETTFAYQVVSSLLMVSQVPFSKQLLVFRRAWGLGGGLPCNWQYTSGNR